MFDNPSPVSLEIFCHLTDQDIKEFSKRFKFGEEYWTNLLCEYYSEFVPLKPIGLSSERWYQEVKDYTFNMNGLMKAVQKERSAVISLIMGRAGIFNEVKANPQIKEMLRDIAPELIAELKNPSERFREDFRQAIKNRNRSYELLPEARPFISMFGLMITGLFDIAPTLLE